MNNKPFLIEFLGIFRMKTEDATPKENRKTLLLLFALIMTTVFFTKATNFLFLYLTLWIDR